MFHPGLLPENNPAYGLTIHKSQGSEYHKILIIIPSDFSPLLTRELFYTAITRLKYQKNVNQVQLYIAYGDQETLFKMINEKNERFSNLKEELSSERT